MTAARAAQCMVAKGVMRRKVGRLGNGGQPGARHNASLKGVLWESFMHLNFANVAMRENFRVSWNVRRV